MGHVPEKGALSERVIAGISDAVVSGKLAAGDRLPPERKLAGQFGVSRTVVRDAIKTLSGRGILRARRGSGNFVADPGEDVPTGLVALAEGLSLGGEGFGDLFEVRKVLEAQAAHWAARRRSEHHVGRLRGIVEEAYRHAGDPDVLNETDARFHVAVAEASQNLVLVRVMFALLDLLATIRRETLDIAGRARLSLDEHERIIEEIERQAPEAAREAMLAHLISVESAVRFSDRQRSREEDGPQMEE